MRNYIKQDFLKTQKFYLALLVLLHLALLLFLMLRLYLELILYRRLWLLLILFFLLALVMNLHQLAPPKPHVEILLLSIILIQ